MITLFLLFIIVLVALLASSVVQRRERKTASRGGPTPVEDAKPWTVPRAFGVALLMVLWSTLAMLSAFGLMMAGAHSDSPVVPTVLLGVVVLGWLFGIVKMTRT
jgi:UDP-N-acetylmuramyl pentapeptide phosphotransferase/UDP-N-acetylglucosamine-1-phosphate transferase